MSERYGSDLVSFGVLEEQCVMVYDTPTHTMFKHHNLSPTSRRRHHRDNVQRYPPDKAEHVLTPTPL